MLRRTIPPFRADHVGSLLRPKNLLQARADHANASATLEELRGVEDEAIRDVVRMQEDLGLQTATDGEFRRTSWHMDFIYQLRGIAMTDEKIEVHFRNASGELDFTSAALGVVGKIDIDGPIFGADFEFLQSVVDSATPKLTSMGSSLNTTMPVQVTSLLCGSCRRASRSSWA
jgi:5-methyltetrahydropteroyltriglutamate--homocysteine methyltransferase